MGEDARDKLMAPDIAVTNASDKGEQLQHLAALDEYVRKRMASVGGSMWLFGSDHRLPFGGADHVDTWTKNATSAGFLGRWRRARVRQGGAAERSTVRPQSPPACSA